jgi:hypothetical protein
MSVWLNTRWVRSLSLLWLGVVLLLWHCLSAGEISLSAALFLFSIAFGCYFLGDLFLGLALQDNERFASLSSRLAMGIILADLLVYVLVIALRFGPAIDWLIVFAGASIAWALVRSRNPERALPAGNAAEAILLLVLPVGITLWCRELLAPVRSDGPVVVIRAWQDIYDHLCEIAGFAASKGIGTISDFHMAGVHAVPYHQAGYMLSAALVDATGISALASYASVLVPLGLLTAALASYSLASSVFGRWPALAGGLALVLLPDATQHGAGNPLFGYHWMMQSAPAFGYGVACAAIAFMLLHEACRTGRYFLVALSWLFVLFTLLHKAQMFFAIAYPALIFPSLFFPGLSRKLRIISALLLTGIYWAVTAASQAIPGVPLIRLDGSGLMPYSRLVLDTQSAGSLRESFNALFVASAGCWPGRAAVFTLLLVTCTFGFYAILYLVQLRQLRSNEVPRVWTFPLLVGAFYLLTSECLALDNRLTGTPEELLHRPFVWAYFIVVLWSVAAAYRTWFGPDAPAAKGARWSLAAAVLMLLLVPLEFGRGIQTFASWGFVHQRLPAGLVNVANFIRARSRPGELVQNSQSATGIILAALSERLPYAISANGIREPAGLQTRLEALERLKHLSDDRQVDAFMKTNAIRWYVIGPRDHVRWAEGGGIVPVYQSGGYRAYRFE